MPWLLMLPDAQAKHAKIIKEIKLYLINLYDNSSRLRKANPKRLKELRDSL